MFLKSHMGSVMTVVIALVMGIIMAVAAIIVGHLGFNISNFFKIWAMITLVVLLVSLVIPYQKWGAGLAAKLGCREGSLAFRLVSAIVTALVINTCMTVCLSAANILYNDQIPREAQMGVWVSSMLHDWPIMLVISYVASFPSELIAMKVARSCVK